MLNEIRDGWSHFIDRLKSPFGGTFIFIWIITHWEFIYYLIFVSSDVTAEERIINFKFFFQGSLGKRFILDVLQPALLTFLAIATYHSFSIVAGVITGAFKRYLEPWISDELGTGPTVLKSELDLESQRLMKLQLELTKCQDLRNDESRRNLGSEQELKSSINVYLGQLNNANAKINDIENRLKILSEGDNKQLSDLHYKQRLKELRCLDFRNDRHPGLRDIMKDKKYNFYFDDVTKSFNRESFNLDDSSYLVDGVKKYNISTVMINHIQNQVYFEKRDMKNNLVYINLINYSMLNNGTYFGFELNYATQKMYKILYSPVDISEFQNYFSGTEDN